MEVPRRSVLLLGVGAIASGCSSGRPTSEAPRSTPTPSPKPSPKHPQSPRPSPSSPTFPHVTRWQPSPNDLQPECKAAAVRHVEQAGNAVDRALEVIDAQYGGLLTDTASVLVVTRTFMRSGSGVRAAGRTYDVRLSRHGSAWRVDAVNPSRPGPPATTLSADARRVLGSDRIDLPPAARRDVESGLVHSSVLSAMLAVARSHTVGVSVVRSGHPLYVFGTSRLSDHPQGRAFDTWRIDGHPVVDARTSRTLVIDYMHAVAAAGSYNVGGPYLLGSPPQWFSDDTHHDHVHAGFNS